MLVGIIDSGKGGLNYLRLIYDKNNQYILIMDKAFFPYGLKSKTFLRIRTLYLVRYLINQGVEKIILGCNTLSVIALDFVLLFYPNVSGIFGYFYPYFNEKTVFVGSRLLVDNLHLPIQCLDGTELIDAIEKKQDILQALEDILVQIPITCNRILLGCSHFISIKDCFPPKYELIYQKKN